ncbi:hypothetical protein JCM11251_006863 [Rhodosporidiobolus azoricus]
MATLDERLQAASSFLLQSPPGEVNDVFSDIRTIVSADSELEVGILPALKQYNRDQFTVVQVEGEKGKVLLTPVSKVSSNSGEEDKEDSPAERHIDPRGQRTVLVDHMKVTASSPSPLPVDPETEPLRSSFEKLLDAYVSNHYSDGVAAVYALEDPAYPPEPEPEVEAEAESASVPPVATEEAKEDKVEEGTGETGAIAEDVEGSKEDVADAAAETAEQAAEALPIDEGEKVQGEAPEVAEEDKMDIGTPTPAEEAGERIGKDAQEEEEVAAPAPVKEKPQPKPRPSRLFGLYFVGNKYNPSNYWTGRWRATYTLDYEKGTLEGKAQIQVHYYEQGNVQLTTTLTSSTPLSPSPSPESVLSALKSSESSFQRQLSSTYEDLADEGFRGLRRALPKTKSKINWEAVGGMRVGKVIGGGQ